MSLPKWYGQECVRRALATATPEPQRRGEHVDALMAIAENLKSYTVCVCGRDLTINTGIEDAIRTHAQALSVDAERWRVLSNSPQTALMLGSNLDPMDVSVDWKAECNKLADAERKGKEG